jgi:hypothetical protein
MKRRLKAVKPLWMLTVMTVRRGTAVEVVSGIAGGRKAEKQVVPTGCQRRL